jgi:hypothetical protein
MFIVDLHTYEQLVLSRVVPEVSSSVLGTNEEVTLGEVSLPTLLFLLSLPPPSSVLQRMAKIILAGLLLECPDLVLRGLLLGICELPTLQHFLLVSCIIISFPWQCKDQ